MADETRFTNMNDAPKTSPPPPRSGLRWVVLALGVIVAVAGILLYRYFGTYESTDDAQVDGHLDPISARISGYVTKVNVDDNQYV